MCIAGACPAQVWGHVCLLSSLIQAPTQALDQGEGNKLLTFGTKCQGASEISVVKIKNVVMQYF